MEPRLDLQQVAPQAYQAMLPLERYVATAGLDRRLLHLVKVYASSLNHCAFCLDMHTREALADGEDDRRLHTVAAWREAGWFTDTEQAALALTEAVTLVAESHVPEQVWTQARQVFDETQLAGLLMAIVAINGWNRLAVATRMPPPDQT
jgi:AhpD family alkylhydroperoxidase